MYRTYTNDKFITIKFIKFLLNFQLVIVGKVAIRKTRSRARASLNGNEGIKRIWKTE